MMDAHDAETIVERARSGQVVVVVTGQHRDAESSPEFLSIVMRATTRKPSVNTLLTHGYSSLRDKASGGSVHVIGRDRINEWARGRTADAVWIFDGPLDGDAAESVRLMAKPRSAPIFQH